MFTEFLILLVTLVAAYCVWEKYRFSYWQRHGIKYVKPVPLLGNFKQAVLGKRAFFDQVEQLYTAPGFEKEPMVGVYLLQRPALIIRDLELVKTIMIKKFNFFGQRAMHTDPHGDPLGYNNLVFVSNSKWKDLRSKLSPVFTSGKTKQMYPLMTQVGRSLEDHLAQIQNGKVMAIKNICARFTTDMISTIAFGIQANSLNDENSSFYKATQEMFKLNLSRGFDFSIILMMPWLASLARVKLFSKKTTDFLWSTVTHVMAEREKSGGKRNDLIDVLVAMKREAAENPDKPNEARNMAYLVAQAAIFQTAGYETSASTMTMALFELAHDPEIQDRLRNEILDNFGDDNEISYENIQEMPYLAQVVNETLRKYPIAGHTERECTQPETGERFNLAPYADFEVPNGMPIYVSTLGIHHDEKYWPNPKKFDPDRFAPENRSNLNMDAYMPFGVGPRNCIGMRLGLLQTKMGLVHFLHKNRVVLCDKTIKEIQIAPLALSMASKEEIYVMVERA